MCIRDRSSGGGAWVYAIGDGRDRVIRDQSTLRISQRQASGERRKSENLADRQREWAGRLRVETAQYGPRSDGPEAGQTTTDETEAALLLTSTFAEVEVESGRFGRDLLRTYLSNQDLSDLMTKDVALFIGFSSKPGPTRLCCRPAGSRRDFRAVQPERR